MPTAPNLTNRSSRGRSASGRRSPSGRPLVEAFPEDARSSGGRPASRWSIRSAIRSAQSSVSLCRRSVGTPERASAMIECSVDRRSSGLTASTIRSSVSYGGNPNASSQFANRISSARPVGRGPRSVATALDHEHPPDPGRMTAADPADEALDVVLGWRHQPLDQCADAGHRQPVPGQQEGEHAALAAVETALGDERHPLEPGQIGLPEGVHRVGADGERLGVGEDRPVAAARPPGRPRGTGAAPGRAP